MPTGTKPRATTLRVIDIDGSTSHDRIVSIGDVLYTYDFRSASGSMAYGGAWARASIARHEVLAITPKGDRIAFALEANGRPDYESVHSRSFFVSIDAAKAGLDRRRAETIASLRSEIAAVEAIARDNAQDYVFRTVRNDD